MTDPTIDKAALEAAMRAVPFDKRTVLDYLYGGAILSTDDATKLLTVALTAYLSALPPTTDGVRVTVRELEWHPIVLGSTSSVADASFGEYTVEHYTEAATGDGWLAIYEDNRKLGYFGTEAAAKSACAEDRTARIMASLNISEVEPVPEFYAWRWASSDEWRPFASSTTEAGRADFIRDQEKIAPVVVKPFYPSPTTSPLAPEGVRDDVLDRDELLAITEHLLMLADIDEPDPAEPDCTDLCGTRVCNQLGCVVSKWRRVRT